MIDPMEIKRAVPADRPHRRRPLPGARRLVPRPAAPPPATTGSCGPTRRAPCSAACTCCRARRSPGCCATATRVVGVQTPLGDIAAGIVMSAVGGDVSTVAAMAGLRLPIRTHPLQAFVTNGYAQGFGPIVVVDRSALLRLADGARPDADRRTSSTASPSYSRQSSFQFLQSCSLKMAYLLPFVRNLKILRQWTGVCDISADFSPIMGFTGVDGLPDHHRLGDVGLQGDPRRRRADGRADRHGRTPDLIAAVRALDRFAADHADGRPGLGGDALMLTIVCPTAARGRSRSSASAARSRSTGSTSGGATTPRARAASAGSTRPAATAG